MNMNKLLNSVNTSLINNKTKSEKNLQIQVLNNMNIKTIVYIVNNLKCCDEFMFSVAFVTKGGVALLKTVLLELEEKNIPGKIVCGDYLGFTDPEALKELNNFNNIEVRLNINSNMHEKGYYFKKGNIWTSIIGSSNLTQGAMTKNKELNIQISSSFEGQFYVETLKEFNKTFSVSKKLEEIIDYYENQKYKKGLNQQLLKPIVFEDAEIKPNIMQKEALEKLNIDRKQGKKKSLVISATGSGKTYLAAFDVKQFDAEKMIFIVHREDIARKALQTFKKVLPEKSMGLFTGNKKDLESDYIFATIQTISKDNYLKEFDSEFFDYIIVDEVHHSGGNTYQKVLNYFKPKFLLGLTATPERTDDFNIYELFDYNVSYEIRLYKALEENLLVPFHYYGISDTINYEGKEKSDNINEISIEERCKHILEKSNFYSHSGSVLHSLIFVSNISEAFQLEEKLKELGIKVKALTGQHNQEEREEAVKKFERGEYNYLITVDIFNEGIDIPKINQVIFLRRTKSSIIFIQQLGRGLRLSDDKEYLVVLDFIGNYDTDFLIPIALSQNSNYEKDNMLQFIFQGTRYIPGESTINFEKIARERILGNIARVNMSQLKIIKKDYHELEKKLGYKPLLTDFYENNKISPKVILGNKKFKSNIEFSEYFENKKYSFSKEDRERMSFMCQKFTPAKRPHEIIIIKELLKGPQSLEELTEKIEREYSLSDQKRVTENALLHLMKEISQTMYKNFEKIVTQKEGLYYLEITNNEFLSDIIEYNLKYYNDNHLGEVTVEPYKLYSKSEIQRLLLMNHSMGEVSGYIFDDVQKICVAYLNFDDQGSFSSYDNDIVGMDKIRWFSTTRRYLERRGIQTKEGKIATGEYKIYLMGRKNKSNYYYYMGPVEKTDKAEEKNKYDEKAGKELPIVEYLFKLEEEIPLEVYQYFEEEKINEKIN